MSNKSTADNTNTLAELWQANETPNSEQPTLSHNPFPLLHLPAEMRFKIYCDAIASGTTGILRASHFVHDEASPYMRKAGILTIRTESFENVYNIRTPAADFQPSSSIQNIEILVAVKVISDRYLTSFSHLPDSIDMGCLAVFTDAAVAVPRGACYITFDSRICQGTGRPEVMLVVIKRLTGFKTIIVTAIVTGSEDDMRIQKAFIRARNKRVYDMALEELEPIFGPGVWHDAAVQEGRYLEFRPDQD